MAILTGILEPWHLYCSDFLAFELNEFPACFLPYNAHEREIFIQIFVIIHKWIILIDLRRTPEEPYSRLAQTNAMKYRCHVHTQLLSSYFELMDATNRNIRSNLLIFTYFGLQMGNIRQNQEKQQKPILLCRIKNGINWNEDNTER